ncbi:geranylgeranyl pyrophosphate synthase Bts1p [Diutina catenulata]
MDVNQIIATPDVYRPSTDDALIAPYVYVAASASTNGNVRTRFLDAFNRQVYKIEAPLLQRIGEIIQIFHDSSLLIDDIEDSSQYRRGRLAAHLTFGLPLTLNCGNLMYFVALQRAQTELPRQVTQLRPVQDLNLLRYEVAEILVEEMLNLHHGQGRDIWWRDNLLRVADDLPLVEDYLRMVKDKTGGLFRLSIKLLAVVAKEPTPALEKMLPIANLLGIIYQIRDDYLNVSAQHYADAKGLAGEDLLEGKLSLPILWCLQHNRASPVHILLFNYKTPDSRRDQPEILASAIDYLHSCGAMDFSKDLLKQYHDKVLKMLSEVTEVGGSALERIIDSLALV